MRRKLKRTELPADLVIAIGLVWGHLRARQFEEAFLLAQGCLRVWPEDRSLILMHAYAAAEVLEPVDTEKLFAVRDVACEEWIQLVMRRTVTNGVDVTESRNNSGAGKPPVKAKAAEARAMPRPATPPPRAPQRAAEERDMP
jgi:hypothetical protein